MGCQCNWVRQVEEDEGGSAIDTQMLVISLAQSSEISLGQDITALIFVKTIIPKAIAASSLQGERNRIRVCRYFCSSVKL